MPLGRRQNNSQLTFILDPKPIPALIDVVGREVRVIAEKDSHVQGLVIRGRVTKRGLLPVWTYELNVASGDGPSEGVGTAALRTIIQEKGMSCPVVPDVGIDVGAVSRVDDLEIVDEGIPMEKDLKGTYLKTFDPLAPMA